jgi:hypothetical protein
MSSTELDPIQRRWAHEDEEQKNTNRIETIRSIGKLVFFGSGIFLTPHFNASHTFWQIMDDWVFAGMCLGAALYLFAQGNPISIKRHLLAGVFGILFLFFGSHFLLNNTSSYTYNLFMHGQNEEEK